MQISAAARDRLWWAAATLSLPLVALFVYVANEWLFFATKVSALTGAPWREQVLAFLTAGAVFADDILLVQIGATLIAITSPRFRVIGVIPAAVVVGLLALIVADNFTYVVFGFSSIHGPRFTRYVYLPLILVTAAAVSHVLSVTLQRYRRTAGRATLAAMSLIALLLVTTAAVEAASGGSLGAAGRNVRTDASAASSQPVTANANGAAADLLGSDAERLPVTPQEGSGAEIGRLNVLFLASDGIDAERMSVYGYEHPTTPFLESIRDETLFFENAFTNSGTSYSSIVTLLTGRLPTSTRVLYPPAKLEGEAARQHFPGILRDRGYRAIQLSVRHYADAIEANLDGAFDLANYRWERVLLPDTTTLDSSLASRLREDIAERLETRVLHILGISEAPDPYRVLTDNTRESDTWWGDERRVSTFVRFIRTTPEPWFAHLHLIDTHGGNYPEEPEERVGADGYDTVIHAADRRFRMIVEALEAEGQLERTIIVISSDHGSGWDTRRRIPLMIRFPGGAHAGRVQANVQLADVAPTILDFLRIPVPEWMDGVSLLDDREVARDRPVVAIRAVHTRPTRDGLVLRKSGPPNHGAACATVVIGSQWLELNLQSGDTISGAIGGHTRPNVEPVSDDEAKRVLVAELAKSGFRVSPPPRPALRAQSD